MITLERWVYDAGPKGPRYWTPAKPGFNQIDGWFSPFPAVFLASFDDGHGPSGHSWNHCPLDACCGALENAAMFRPLPDPLPAHSTGDTLWD